MAIRPGKRRLGLVLALVVALLAVPLAARSAVPEDPLHLQVVTKSFPPFVIVEGKTASGFSIDLLDKMSARMNFTYDLQIVDTVAEQLERVQTGQADMAIAGISITSEREKDVDFSHPMFHSGLQILAPTEGDATPSVGASLLRSLWPLLVKLAILLVVVAHVIWISQKFRDPKFPRGYLRGVGEGLWFAAESIATVGYGDGPPRRFIGRIAAIAWMFFAIFLVANLTGSISADLVAQQIHGNIQGPEDLPGKRVATAANTTSADYLEARNIDPVGTATIDESFELLRTGEVEAVVFDSPVLRYHASGEGAGQVRVVGPRFSLQDYGIAVPTGSPLRKPVNETLLSLFEDGTYDRLEQSWFGKT